MKKMRTVAATEIARRVRQSVLHELSEFRVSYSDLGEDLILERILNRYLNISKDYVGVYIDVGAFHPTISSTTKCLYDLGWTGIVCDISSETIQLFQAHRPRDIAIHAAVSSSLGKTTAFCAPGISRGNTADPKNRKRKLMQGMQELEIATTTLNQILIDTNFHSRTIDYLNIDVEGLEMEVLNGLDFEKSSPTIISIEVHNTDLTRVLESEIYSFLKEKQYRWVAACAITQFFVLNSRLSKGKVVRKS